jgi:hypothetical protein
VLLCGGGHLSLALLLELARPSWEEARLAVAAEAGQHSPLKTATAVPAPP